MNFICADTEDDSKELRQAGKSGFNKKLTQVCALADGEDFYARGEQGREKFKLWFLRRKETTCYFHNLQYDLGNLFGDTIDELDCLFVGGRIIRATWKGKRFLDTFNIWPMSLKKIGQAFGLEKLETESMAHDDDYVYRDCEIMQRCMTFAWEFGLNQGGMEWLPSTLGGICVKLWKHWGGKNCHDTDILSREGLYGGRVELFKQHNETAKVCYTDINSLYPSVMLGEFPEHLSPVTSTRLPEFGIVRATVEIPKNESMAPLPFRRKDRRIVYPVGRITGVWPVCELHEAERNGVKIIKVIEARGSKTSQKPYADFVTRLYDMRQKSQTGAESLFYKLCMNNLYGRLGNSGIIQRTVWQTSENRLKGVPYGGKVLIKYQLPFPPETNWSHAAYVTGLGRLALLRHLRTIGPERMIYCDTDSTIFDCPDGQIPFPIGKQLGQMKLESWQSNCETFAPKMYRLGDTFKAKGVPVAKAQSFIEHGRAEFDLPFKFRESLRFFDNSNKRKLSVWRAVVKVKRGKYDKKTLKNNRYYPLQMK